jgi:hypothetical protein
MVVGLCAKRDEISMGAFKRTELCRKLVPVGLPGSGKQKKEESRGLDVEIN